MGLIGWEDWSVRNSNSTNKFINALEIVDQITLNERLGEIVHILLRKQELFNWDKNYYYIILGKKSWDL